MAVDGWAVTFGTARRGPGRLRRRPVPSSLYQNNVTAHPLTASVPITVLLYDSRLLCGFNLAIKGLMPGCLLSQTDNACDVFKSVSY